MCVGMHDSCDVRVYVSHYTQSRICFVGSVCILCVNRFVDGHVSYSGESQWPQLADSPLVFLYYCSQ